MNKSSNHFLLKLITFVISVFIFICCSNGGGGGDGDSGVTDNGATFDFDDGVVPSAFGMTGGGWGLAGMSNSSGRCLRARGNSLEEACLIIAGTSSEGNISFLISTKDTRDGQDYGNTSFYIDDIDYSSGLKLAPAEEWHKESVSIAAGSHIYKWCADYNDAFLDDITIPGFTLSQANVCEDPEDITSAMTAYGQGIASATIDNGTNITDPNHFYYKYRNGDSSVTIDYDFTLSGGVPQSGNGKYTFSNYSNSGVTVDGSINYTIVYSSATAFDYTYGGTISYSGGADFDITYDYSYSYNSGTVTYAGSLSIGDCTYTYNSDGTITGD